MTTHTTFADSFKACIFAAGDITGVGRANIGLALKRGKTLAEIAELLLLAEQQADPKSYFHACIKPATTFTPPKAEDKVPENCILVGDSPTHFIYRDLDTNERVEVAKWG